MNVCFPYQKWLGNSFWVKTTTTYRSNLTITSDSTVIDLITLNLFSLHLRKFCVQVIYESNKPIYSYIHILKYTLMKWDTEFNTVTTLDCSNIKVLL